MNRILEIDNKNLTATVEPGVITADLHKKVAAYDLFYPPDPGSAADCTLGGNVAENAGGIRGLKYGVTGNYVLGMDVVLPQGEFLRLGGKGVRDVAGYNLKDLLIGSEGTLAIFTQFTLRLLPRPKAARTWLASFPSVEHAGEAILHVFDQRLAPACVELIDRITWQAIQKHTGTRGPEAGALVLLEIDGSVGGVREEGARVEKAFRQSRATAVRRARDAAESESLKALRRCAFLALSALGKTPILEDATVPRAHVAEMIHTINRIARKHKVTIGNFGHAGDGNLHPTCLIDGTQAKERARAASAFEEIYAAALRFGGTITGEHGVGLAKRDVLPKQWPPQGMELLRRVKAAFDPKGLLNPGKIFRGRPRCE